ncbi:MAG: ABC transporter ATP-binding protein, partial [Actinomycetota bacterium]
FKLVGIVFGLAMFGALVTVAIRFLSSKIGEGLIFDLRVALFDHVQRMPIAFFTRTQTGSLISHLNNDVVGAQRAVTDTIGTILSTVIDVTITLTVMFILNWQVTLVTLVLVPIFVIPNRRIGKVLQKFVKRQMELNASMNTQMTERFQVGGALLTKLFGSPKVEIDAFSRRAGDVRDLGIKTALYGRVFFVLFGFTAAVGTAMVYLIGGIKHFDQPDVFTIGTITAFAAYLTRLYAPITMLTNARVEMMTAFVSFDRVFEVLDFPSSIIERVDAIELFEPKGSIDFTGVWFRYPAGSEVSIASLEEGKIDTKYDPEAWVLQDVSLRVERGQMFALVGPSGAGKTTLSMLVPRLYDVTQGVVKIDGIDVRDLTLPSLSRAVGVVTQDAHMFHDSIRSNMLYAKPDATENDLIEAAKAAQIYDLIASLPDGFDTTVGERGYRLSGGEKQRLAIARLLLKDPAIMILDEATAHLDSESEVLIQRALAEALQGRSSLVIAHRLSTIVKADQILVIDGGRIVERGTHHQLLAAGGLYEDLYTTQFSPGATART